MTSTATGSWTATSSTRTRTPHPSGDVCGSMLQPNGQPTQAFQTFGRAPTAAQLFTANSFCGRTENSSQLHRDYCAASGQNLLSGSGVRRSEWQFGLGVQHEILPRLSGEVTYNYRKYREPHRLRHGRPGVRLLPGRRSGPVLRQPHELRGRAPRLLQLPLPAIRGSRTAADTSSGESPTRRWPAHSRARGTSRPFRTC